MTQCTHDEKWRSDDGGNQSCTVTDAISDFFPLGLITMAVCTHVKSFKHLTIIRYQEHLSGIDWNQFPIK
jgi:hypothetical protein